MIMFKNVIYIFHLLKRIKRIKKNWFNHRSNSLFQLIKKSLVNKNYLHRKFLVFFSIKININQVFDLIKIIP